MKYPKFLEKGDLIGITAPSNGIRKEKEERFDAAIESLMDLGYKVTETKSVRNGGIVSTDEVSRALELDSLVSNEDVKMILCAAGGDFLMEMLPHINYDNIKKNPKWIQGYSDPTLLLYPITVNYDIATIYGYNARAYAMKKKHESILNNLEILKGNLVKQKSFKKYELKSKENKDGYNLTKKVKWKTLNGDFYVKGRIIGGCLDSLNNLVGTKYDGTKKFVKKYAEDGIIWYFDIFSLTSEDVARTLWSLREAGWFENAKAFVFSRVKYPNTFLDMTYEEAIRRILKDTNIVIDTDFGHVMPKMTIINGAICELEAKNKKGSISFELK